MAVNHQIINNENCPSKWTSPGVKSTRFSHPFCHPASLKLARHPQERIIVWSATPFLCCFDQQRHQQNLLQWAKSGVSTHGPQELNQTHQLVACRALNIVAR